MPTDFITYAQNAEDVMLWRSLGHIERGFYIDVGAQDPVVDSVTKAFYERGWRGINIEPVEFWFRRLTEDRPHDINLQVATSDRVGEVVLFSVKDTGLSTSDPILAKRYRNEGRTVSQVAVKCRTLDDICAEHSVHTVHFLKIDCEGAEKQTLEGIALERIRPWVIVVEATAPNSLEPTHRKWENLLTDRGYAFAYFDGLNRFYLAQEHSDLRKAFRAPPTPAEWKERAPVVFAHQKIDHLTRQLVEFQSVERVVRAESERDHWHDQAQYWIEESARRERAMSELRKLVDALREESHGLLDEIGRLQREAATASNELARTEQARNDAQFKLLQEDARAHRLEDEILRLQREVAGFMQRRESDDQAKHELQLQLVRANARTHELQVEIARMRASHSWVVTAPLRGLRRAISRSAWQLTKMTLRPAARALRPWLRTLSRHDVLRKPVVGALGRDSALVRHARLFLFGQPVQADPQTVAFNTGAGCDGDPGIDPSATSARERVVMKALREARVRASGRGHTPCE